MTLKANHVWEIWWPSTMGLQQQWMRKKQRILYTWTCAKQLTLPCMTSSFVRWRDVDLMDGLLSRQNLAGWLHSESGWPAQYPTESSEEWYSSGDGTEMSIFNIFVGDTDSGTESTLSKLLLTLSCVVQWTSWREVMLSRESLTGLRWGLVQTSGNSTRLSERSCTWVEAIPAQVQPERRKDQD